MAGALVLSCISLLLYLLIGALGAEDPVPILAWSNRDTFSSVIVNDGSEIDVESLVQKSKFSKLELVLVFRTEKLNFEDIAKYGSIYGDGDKINSLVNIQSEMSNSVSSLWTGIDGSVASLLISEIAEKIDMSPNFISGIEDVAVIFGQPQLLVVDLPYGDSEEEFAQQDAMIAEVLEGVHHLDTAYAAFYTAMTSENDRVSNSFHTPLLAKRDTSHLTTSSESCTTSYGVKDSDGSYCALLCMTNSTILYWETQSDLERGNEPCVGKITAFDEQAVSGCNNSTIGAFPSIFATMEANCSSEESPEVVRADLELTFPRGNFEHSGQRMLEAGSWQMIIIAGPHNLSRYGEGKLVYPFSIPIGLSYACQTQSTASIRAFSNPNRFAEFGNLTDEEVIALYNEGDSPVVQFIGIHIQAHGYTSFVNGEPVFNTVYDCNGYFTLSSWMGVFSVVILLIVLYVSVVFAFSVQSIDRFEDPRAPSITIENLH